MCYAVLSPQAHRLRRLLAGAQVHPPIGKVLSLIHISQKAEVVLLCLGLDEIKESEGLDRGDMRLSLIHI